MKYYLLLLISVLTMNANSQVDKKVLSQKVDEMRENSEYDSIVKALGLKNGDKVLVNTIFTINTDGLITDIKTRGIHPYFENEAKRILQNTPELVPENFKPKDENPRFALPITFVIKSKKKKTKRREKEN